jgi:hypothetical protein
MSIAYLIIAHDQSLHLSRLVNTLDSEGVEFYIHIDLKSDLDPFLSLLSGKARVTFLENRERVSTFWCGFSMVEAALNLINTAKRSGISFKRYALLSGSDFPIKNNEFIRETFS